MNSMGNLIRRKALRNILLWHTLYVCLCRLTSSGKSEHVFIQKIIKSFNKKKIFALVLGTQKDFTNTAACESSLIATRTQQERGYSSWHKIFRSFTTFSFSSLISYQLDLVSSGSEPKVVLRII